MKHEIALEDLENAEMRKNMKKMIIEGRVFVYPTDTVYGIGCNALIEKSVKRIRKMKGSRQPFSVIAPSKAWIERNAVVEKWHDKYLGLLPGPYTFILKKKDRGFLKEASPLDSIGIRVPDHPFSRITSEAGVPFVATSANIHGSEVIKDPKDAEALKADVIIDGGILSGTPSKIIDLTGRKARIIRP